MIIAKLNNFGLELTLMTTLLIIFKLFIIVNKNVYMYLSVIKMQVKLAIIP